jgi:hypothetical protein
MFIQHEQQFHFANFQQGQKIQQYLRRGIDVAQEYERNFMKVFDSRMNMSLHFNDSNMFAHMPDNEEVVTVTPFEVQVRIAHTTISTQPPVSLPKDEEETEKRGLLQCNGKLVDSEVIYWKIVPGDSKFESPITPHHGLHHDRYLSYEYDEGGWNK